MPDAENVSDQGAFSSLPGLDNQTLRSQIEGREYLATMKLLQAKRSPSDWTGPLLYSIHRDVFGQHFPTLAGQNRHSEVNFGRRAAVPPEQIDSLMEQLVLRMRENLGEALSLRIEDEERLSRAFLSAAADHGEMLRIHPFIDGNGRWARMATNAFLTDCGYPPGTIIRARDKPEYITNLDRCMDKNAPGDLAHQFLEGYVREQSRRHV